MQVADHIAALRLEGERLAVAFERGRPDAPVPTCPDWRMGDLVRHLGGVHRWATVHVTESRLTPIGGLEAVVDDWPADADLAAWFRAGHRDLVGALAEAPADLACWSFLPAPSPLAFWARRQAHETAIHRADVEGAIGPVTVCSPELAADGIDELLVCFVSRPGGRLLANPPSRLAFHAPDVNRHWLVTVGPDRVQVSGEAGAVDCSVWGPVSDLYLLLWNRRSRAGLQVAGDFELLDVWRRDVTIRWS